MPDRKGYLTRHQKVTGPSTNVSDAETVDFQSDSNITDVTVVDNGDTATIKIPQGGGSAVSDDGQQVINIVQDLNFGDDLSVTDDGSGQVTIDSTAIGVNTEVYPIPLTEIYNGETLTGPQFRVSSAETVDLLQVGVQNASEQIPTGLRIQVYDLTNDQLLVDQNSKHQTGSPLASVSGVDLELRIKNVTGSDQIASGFLIVGKDGGGSNVDSRTNISDGGVELVTDVSDMNFGTNLSVVDDGDNTVTISASTEGVNTELYNLPYTEVPDGDNVLGAKFNVPSGESVDLIEVGIQNDSEQAPAGLEIVVEDVTNNTELTRQASKHYSSDPIATISGPVDILVKLSNSTGSAQKCSGFIVTASGPSGGGSGSTNDTRTNVSFDGSEVVSNVSDINFTSDATINDVVVDNDNDGSVTVRVPRDEGGLDLEVDDADVQSGIKVLDLVAGNNNVTLSHSSGNETDEAKVMINTTDTDTHADFSDANTNSVTDPAEIRIQGANDASVTLDDTASPPTYTVDVTDTDTHITLSESETNGVSATNPSELVFGTDLDLVDSGGGVYTVQASADAGDTHVQVFDQEPDNTKNEEAASAASLYFKDKDGEINFDITNDGSDNLTIEPDVTYLTFYDTNDESVTDIQEIKFRAGGSNTTVDLDTTVNPPEIVITSPDTDNDTIPDIKVDSQSTEFNQELFHFVSGTDIDINWDDQNEEIVINSTASGGGSLTVTDGSTTVDPTDTLSTTGNFDISNPSTGEAEIDLANDVSTGSITLSNNVVTDTLVDNGAGTVTINTTDSTIPDLSSSRIEATSYLESSTFQPNSGSSFDFQDSSGSSEAGTLNANKFNGDILDATIHVITDEIRTDVSTDLEVYDSGGGNATVDVSNSRVDFIQERSSTSINVVDDNGNTRQGRLSAFNTAFAYCYAYYDSNIKGWAFYGYNVSGVTKDSDGEFTISFSNNPTSTSSIVATGSARATFIAHTTFTSGTSNSVKAFITDSTGAQVDPNDFKVIVYAVP